MRKMHSKCAWVLLTLLGLAVVAVAMPARSGFAAGDSTNILGPMPAAGDGVSRNSTADHRKYEALNRKFRKVREVTKVCLSCHTEAATQIHKTKHWKWDFLNPNTGQKLGVLNLINNFSIATASNMTSCSHCHIGSGWKGDTFDFDSEENVDCLTCHDTTGTYAFKKFHNGRGNCEVCHEEIPDSPGDKKRLVDLTKVALNVGPTNRRNCGSCHFVGGGGVNAKHGDLDPSLTRPDKSLDVHMDAEGLNFTCTTCHSTDQHAVRGSRYLPVDSDTFGDTVPGKAAPRRGTCRSCHGAHPMKNEKLNEHTDKVACQTCHIPSIARGGYPTKTWWDWSTSGRLGADGKQMVERNDKGWVTYTTLKGDARWEENLRPDYVWFNGNVKYTLPNDVIDPETVTPINTFLGGPDDPERRIWPIKRARSRQPYDAGTNKLAAVNMFALHPYAKDPDAYWRNLDWPRAIAKGMTAAGHEFSGKVGFTETEMLWPVNHMVAPVEASLGCKECHSRDGRMAGIEGVYIPGRDSLPLLERTALIILGLTLAGVLIHGFGRFVAGRRASNKGNAGHG